MLLAQRKAAGRLQSGDPIATGSKAAGGKKTIGGRQHMNAIEIHKHHFTVGDVGEGGVIIMTPPRM